MKRLTPTKLFVDGGDPKETAEATRLLNEAGHAGLDGQTTNPSLVAKNPDIAAQIQAGKKLTQEELLSKYKEIVQGIEKSMEGDPVKSPNGDHGASISIEVYADKNTTADEMVAQARDMAGWIASAVVKLPITEAGLAAAEELKGEMKLNMTLCFSQSQAAAVYAATRGSAHPVFVSPFIGRLDDKGINGMDLIANLMRMYEAGDGHAHVLTASVRSVDHILAALQLKTHAMTMPFEKAFKPWAEQGFPLPDENFQYRFEGQATLYEELDISADWRTFNLRHELTDAGLAKFAEDWNSLLQ